MLAFPLIFITGFAAAVGQILVLRELLVLFYGNELSAGLILACWLLLTAAGSWIAGRVLKSGSTDAARLVAGIGALSLMLPATLLWIRSARAVWSIPIGELISPGLMIAMALSSTGLFCFLSGGLFALCWSHAAGGAGIGANTDGAKSGRGGVMWVYLAEAAGSGAGGLCYYFLLLPALPSFAGSVLLSLLIAVAACAAAVARRSGFPGRKSALAFCISAIFINAFLLGFSARIDLASRKAQWGEGFIESRDTPYHNLAFCSSSGQYSLFCNGLWLFSIPDPQTAEPAAHLPLLQHRAPERVLVIGDFSPGLIGEILRHPGVRRLDCVQPDRESTGFVERVLPGSFSGHAGDERLRMIFSDPRRFVASARTGYSVIIMGAGEPVNAEMNRLYTVEFFSRLKNLLEPGGVFSFAVPSAPDIIGQRVARLLRSLKKTLDAAFESVLAVPGGGVQFFAGGAGSISKGPDVLIERMRERGLELQYLRDFHVLDRFDPMRAEYMETIFREGGLAGINRDFEPLCYLHGLSLWGAQLHPAVGKFLDLLSGGWRVWFCVVPFLPVLAAAVVLRARSGPRAAIALNTAVTGGTMIVIEIVLILAYQIISGAMYRELALIISLFMAGVAAGGGLGGKMSSKSKKPLLNLFAAQAAVSGYALFLVAILAGLKDFQAGGWPIGAIFSILAFLAGMLGGIQFASAVAARAVSAGMKSAGAFLYAADLAGAAVGAISGSLLLIPVLGIPQTLMVVALTGLGTSAAILGKEEQIIIRGQS